MNLTKLLNKNVNQFAFSKLVYYVANHIILPPIIIIKKIFVFCL